jgi:leucyl-tRNA synthetase
MELVNAMYHLKDQTANADSALVKETVSALLRMVAVFAPHLTEELWHEVGFAGSVHQQVWPTYDPEAVKVEEVEVVLQINGKVRDKILAPFGISAQELEKLALSQEKVQTLIAGKQVVKVICVPQRLVNIVVK